MDSLHYKNHSERLEVVVVVGGGAELICLINYFVCASFLCTCAKVLIYRLNWLTAQSVRVSAKAAWISK